MFLPFFKTLNVFKMEKTTSTERENEDSLPPSSLSLIFFLCNSFLFLQKAKEHDILSFSNISNATMEQRGLKQTWSVMLSTLPERRLTNIGISRLFNKSRKIVRPIHCTAFPRDKGKNIFSSHHLTNDWEYAEIHYSYFSQDWRTFLIYLAIWSPPVSLSGIVER